MNNLEKRKLRESLLSAEAVRSILDYSPEDGIFRWKADRSYRVKAGDQAGGMAGGYHTIEIRNAKFRSHRLAWLISYGRWPEFDIDHRDGDPSNNRLENLREATRSQNCANRKMRAGSKSGVKGVYWNKSNQKWVASANKTYLGSFSTITEASDAYRRAAEELHGQFARPS